MKIKNENKGVCGINCPFGGDVANDCADCVYSAEYHFVNGECVKR